MYKDTVTIFNRKTDRTGIDLWYATVLRDVNLNVDKGAIVKTYGEQSADAVILNIRHDNNIIQGKTWLPPKDWQRSDSPGDFITFTGGSKFDFFWLGEWTGSGVISDDSYGVMSFYDYMNKNYDFVFAITNVGYFSVIPHFEISGK